IAYGVLQAHRGGLRLHPGCERGVVARVVVPVAAAPAGAEQALEPSPGRANGERVLVVDHEPAQLRWVVQALEQAGYRAQGAGSTREAYEAYTAQQPALFQVVLCDTDMPGLNGVDLARRLHKRDPGVRVVFLGAHEAPALSRQLAGLTCEWL